MQENMFELGFENQSVVDDFLCYSEYLRKEPMCHGLSTYAAVEFLKKQKPFQDCNIYPVEYAVLRHKKKKSTYQARDTYYGKILKEHHYMNSIRHDCGKLRIWWAYNLAIAASQGKM